jgi:hypothetical protein
MARSSDKDLIQAQILASDNRGRKLRERTRKRTAFPKDFANSFGEVLFGVSDEGDKAAVFRAHFAKGRDVRTDDSASGKEGLGNRQPESLDDGWGEKQLAVPIAPLKFRIGDSASENDALLDERLLYQSVNPPGFRSGHANDEQACCGIDFSAGQEAPEDLKREGDVLVAAVLGDAQKEWGAIPGLNQGGLGCRRSGFDAVVDCDSFLQPLRILDAETKSRGVRDARNSIHSAKALPEDGAIEEHLGEAEV